MADKKTAKKEKIENGQVDLQEILGDIKTVVTGEKETLFKVSEYKTINLKKQNLVVKGNKRHATEFIDINENCDQPVTDLLSVIAADVKDTKGNIAEIKDDIRDHTCDDTGNTAVAIVLAMQLASLLPGITPHLCRRGDWAYWSPCWLRK